MKKNDILLSLGTLPWMGTKKAADFARKAGYDGLEFLPTRKSANEKLTSFDLKFIKGIHQNWRLDIGLDKSYGIKFPISILFTILRFILFPKIEKSNEAIKLLSENLNLPIIVHNLSKKWTNDNDYKEFSGGILYEIIGTSINPSELKIWTQKENHNIVLDSRNDQSLLWGKKYGFNTWQKLWKWLGIKKIKGYQLTFIGLQGLRKIFKHEKSLAEEQLLWLHKNKWQGHATVEVNPLILIVLCNGNIKKGFGIISQFVRQTLNEGKKWS